MNFNMQKISFFHFVKLLKIRKCLPKVIQVRSISSTLEPNLQPQENSETKPVKEAEPKWESIIGLEIHAQINADSKLFSGASTKFNAYTNSQVAYFDAAIPGTLPVLNKYCVEAGVRTALALNCTINKTSSFDRKHYFYSDLPAGYQITQQFNPLATNGFIEFHVYDTNIKLKPYKCHVRLKQLQLEQDSGRSFHIEGKRTLIDLNRAGIGLMELVFEPDLKNGREAAMLVKELQVLLTTIGTCNCAMEEGALRVDANISVHKPGEPWGVRTEVKNLNSQRHIAKAIDYEIKRQIKLLKSGKSIQNETRSFDYKSKKTVFMRDKETFQDYRFMPEPNLPIVHLLDDADDISVHKSEDENDINVDEIRRQLPPLPSVERQRLMETYNIPYETADKIIKEPGLKNYFEQVATIGFDVTFAFGFLTNNVQHQLNIRKQNFFTCPVPPHKVKELVELVNDMIISSSTADNILEMFFNGDSRTAKEIVERYNWYLIYDEKDLEIICKMVIKEEDKLAKKYRSSKKKIFMTYLLENLNKRVNYRAHIKKTEEVLIRLLLSKKDKKDKKEKKDDEKEFTLGKKDEKDDEKELMGKKDKKDDKKELKLDKKDDEKE